MIYYKKNKPILQVSTEVFPEVPEKMKPTISNYATLIDPLKLVSA